MHTRHDRALEGEGTESKRFFARLRREEEEVITRGVYLGDKVSEMNLEYKKTVACQDLQTYPKYV